MSKTIGIISTKGGVGKTSTTAALSAILADMGKKVLMIDGDFQQSLSKYYQLKTLSENGIHELITTLEPENCISKTDIENLDIVISNDPDQKLTYWLKESTNNVYFLRAAIQKIKEAYEYDYILIDSQGSKGILQESIVFASDILISPIVPEALDIQEFMRGTLQMLKNLEMPASIGFSAPPIPPLYGLIYKQDRTSDSVRFAELIRNQIHQVKTSNVKILDTYVPKLAAYAQAAARNTPVHRIETVRKGPTQSANQVYHDLVHELFPELKDVTVGTTNTLKSVGV